MPTKQRFRKGDRVFTKHIAFPGALTVSCVKADPECNSGWAVDFDCESGIGGRLDQAWLRHAPKKKGVTTWEMK